MKIKKSLGWLLIATWAILSVGILATFLRDSPGDSSGEIGELLIYGLLTLNFPISTLAVYTAPADPIWQWCYFTIAGFLQWFILFPWLFNWCQRLYLAKAGRQPPCDRPGD